MKSCCHCGEQKRAEDFPANPRKLDGLSSWCRSCHVKASAKWRSENPDKTAAYNERRRAEYLEAREAKRDALRQENVERLRKWTAAEQVRRLKNERARTTRKVA